MTDVDRQTDMRTSSR